jgi:cysteine-rich repeat protein
VIELGWQCTYTGTSSVCFEVCGDGININNAYPCDDGNNLSEDGCSSICAIETGFTCPASGVGACTELCDGTYRGYLPCDSPAIAAACVSCVV